MNQLTVIGDARGFPECDLFIGTLGYESRSTHLARVNLQKIPKGCAIYFGDREGASFPSNKIVYEQAGFELIKYDENFEERITNLLARTKRGSVGLSVAVDISSMSRPMMARIVQVFRTIACDQARVTFLYCPAAFSEPSSAPHLITESGPVIPELAGWTNNPMKPLTAIVGLGYEYDQAMGTLENLEPATAWAFIPYGEDERYEKAVDEANADLYNFLKADNLNKYHVGKPYACFQMLESLAYGLVEDSRPILIPFGPKLFALMCILVATIHSPDVTVWRVSGGQSGEPIDRVASGRVFGLEVLFSRCVGSL